MGNIFDTFLVQPLFNLLVFLYNVIPGADMGFAIIALTIIIKLVLWPLNNSTLKSQKAMQELQPKMDAIKATHKDNKEALAKATMELYQTEKVNPLSSCLPILVQFPILIALYHVLLQGFKPDALKMLYPFVYNPEVLEKMFLGFVDLAVPSIGLALIAGIFQFFQTRMLMHKKPTVPAVAKEGAKDETMLASMNKSMMYLMPIMTVVIGASLPGGLSLYWVTITVFSIVQQMIVFRKKNWP